MTQPKKKTAPKKATAKATTKKRVVKKKAAVKKRAAKKVAASKQARVSERPEVEDASTGDSDTLVLSSVLGTNNAKGLHRRLAKAIDEGGDVKIDASSVKMIDTAILQLLVAFVSELRDLGITFEWSGQSEDFVARAKVLDLQEVLGLSG